MALLARVRAAWKVAQEEGQDKKTLHEAVTDGNYLLVQNLIDQGGDLNVKDSQGQIPMHKAVLQADSKMVNLLIHSVGTKINIKDNEGRTPKDIVPFVKKKLQEERTNMVLESLRLNAIQNRNSPNSSSVEIAFVENETCLDDISEMLHQPAFEHRESTRNLYKAIENEQNNSENPHTLEALTQVLEHHFDVKPKTPKTENNTTAKVSKSNTPKI